MILYDSVNSYGHVEMVKLNDEVFQKYLLKVNKKL